MQIVYSGWARIATSANILDDVLRLLEMPLPAGMQVAAVRPLPFNQEIAFRNVSFAYGPDQAPVVEELDFVIPKGARVGIVGRTGSGKSTMADLLMGLLEPTQGHIEIDGQLLDANTRQAWQRQIAHVPQAIFLSDASIAENIAFAVEPGRIDQARVRECARQAELANFIESLPEGYGTLVGERGVRLSGGQRQRVGIARALYKQAELLVFDEATSALDTETESAVMDAIERLGRRLTIVIIAHRVSTVAGCSRVLRLDRGRIVQCGGYEHVVQGEARSAHRRTGTDVSG
jgi:ABC-type multidrug transport system fused ATPase/permease subunit